LDATIEEPFGVGTGNQPTLDVVFPPFPEIPDQATDFMWVSSVSRPNRRSRAPSPEELEEMNREEEEMNRDFVSFIDLLDRNLSENHN
jgi:hypothetical protein